MRKFIFYLFLISLLIVSCSQDNKGYDALEKGLIGILEKKDEGYILQQLGKAAEQKNEDVFALAYVYLGTQGEEFYNKFLKKSNGYAEYYKAMFLKETNGSEDEIINLLESSAKQGNNKAYYMLGSIYESKFEFSKAQEYLKKGKDAGEIYAVYSYNYNKNLSDVFSRIEELNKKLKNDTINQEEKKELGTLIVEKVSNYEEGYNILKDFLSEGYPPALYAKAKIIESEDKEDEAIQIYNEIFMKNKYYLAAFELASKLVKSSKNYELAMKVLDDTNSDEPVITGYKGFVYENMKQYKKAEENYLKAVEKNDIGIMIYLGSLYDNMGETKKAKDIYTKAYQMGSVDAGYKLTYLLEEIEETKLKENENNKKENSKDEKKEDVKKSKEAKRILENLVKNGDDYSMVDLSLYYPEGDPNIRILNLKAAAKLNKTAFYNLGVYYYSKKNKVKAKFYLKVAKENGYDIGAVFERYIIN